MKRSETERQKGKVMRIDKIFTIKRCVDRNTRKLENKKRIRCKLK
jgi:hypothetical protein